MNKKELRNTIDRILWEDWDPIGINDSEGPTDEYRTYVSSVMKLVEEGAHHSKLVKLLHHHANVNMGLSTYLTEHITVAKKLAELHN